MQDEERTSLPDTTAKSSTDKIDLVGSVDCFVDEERHEVRQTSASVRVNLSLDQESVSSATGRNSSDGNNKNRSKHSTSWLRSDKSECSVTGNRYPNPISGTRTMNICKSQAIVAALALKAQQEQDDKRRIAYIEAVGPSRMGFCNGNSEEEDAFEKAFFQFLDDEQKIDELQKREKQNRWTHTFSCPSDESSKKNSTETSADIGSLGSAATDTLMPKSSDFADYASSLPVSPEGSIFVRVPEDRLDLPRILITGTQGTPYSIGLFFFDVLLENCPQVPPKVKFLTTTPGSLQLSPDLYSSGKVCLSLLGTASGPAWDPKSSTLLEVLTSCQELILGKEYPFGTQEDDEHPSASVWYNREIRKQTLRWGILDPLQKLVLQEERVEHRRLVLEQLKQQKQVREDNRATLPLDEEESTSQGSLECDSGFRGTGWALSWRKNPPQATTSPLLLSSSDMPKRKDWEYKEFTDVVIQHFVQQADQLEEQLESWEQWDPRIGTITLAEQIRAFLKRLFDLVEERQQRKEQNLQYKPTQGGDDDDDDENEELASMQSIDASH